MTSSRLDPRGAYTALVTPFTADGAAVDETRLQAGIRRQAEGGVSGIVPCGTTGETPTLRDDEYRLVVERAIACGHEHGLTVIPGAGSNSTAHAVALHRFAHDAGADGALHVTPYYNKPSAAGLERHFMTIADSCDLPIVLYNIPGRTGVGLAIETIERLAAHPNVVAIKEASGTVDLTSRIVGRTGLTVLSGDDPLTLPLAIVGATGVISVLANVCPDRVAAMCRAFLDDEWEQARSIHASLLPLATGLLVLDTNPVPLKTALHLLELDTGAVRLPLCPPGPGVTERLRQLLDACGVEAATTARAT
jgi:4-hydroxy-tetrahydrodipicolinate synthase